MKKDGLFDGTMGTYGGAEVCGLIGTFLLAKISEKYDKRKYLSCQYLNESCQYLKTKATLNLKE